MKAFPSAMILVLSCLTLWHQPCLATDTTASESSLSSLVEYGLSHSADRKAAAADTRVQQQNQKFSHLDLKIPQVELAAGYQSWTYDHLFQNPDGSFVSNNGQNPTVGLTASYDLQKLFGAEQALSDQAVYQSQIQEKITRRAVIRAIKNGYYEIREIQGEVAELQKQIGLFKRIDSILQKQKQLGVYNELEREQFQIQSGLLDADLQAKTNELAAAFGRLSTLMTVDVDETRRLVDRVTTAVPLRYAEAKSLKPSALSQLNDHDMLENLARDYNAAQLEYEKTVAIPLPVVYLKGGREVPTMPSADGPQTLVEVGLTYPLNALFTRPAAKEELSAKTSRGRALLDKALFEYRYQVRLDAESLARLNGDQARLIRLRDEATKLQERSFTFFSQKRLDALGTLDVFAKSLQSSRLVMANDLQIKELDTELEYLLGDAGL